MAEFHKKKSRSGRATNETGKDEATIYKVCPEVRSCDREAYEPSMVSIGPYHRGKEHLQVMEELKWQYLNHHLSKCLPEGGIDKYLTQMKELEAKTRRCYSEDVKLSSNEFVEMMLLDGCFLAFILLPRDESAKWPGEQLRETLWFDYILINDLLKLENQLPFFIVEFFREESKSQRQLKVDALNFLEHALSSGTKFGRLDTDLGDLHADHFLHLFHMYFFSFKAAIEKSNMPSSPSCCKPAIDQVKKIKTQLLPKIKNHLLLLLNNFFLPPNRLMKRIPSAMDLKGAGVKLKSSDKETFFDISFNNGVLEIPPFHVDDSTNCIFRNLIALEQCCPRFGNVVTCYALFMDSIINTQNDVELLEKVGIIENDLGYHTELALLFNNIGKNITYDPKSYYLARVIKEVNTYCESRWPKWRSRLMHDYFSNPWSIISFIASCMCSPIKN